MKEYSFLHVSYDESQKDLPCLICCATNYEQIKMLVGYVGEDADEIYRIITEQGYLKEHDEKIRADERMKVMNETRLFVDMYSVELGKKEGIKEFAEWSINSKYHGICNEGFVYGVSDLNFKFSISKIDEILAEYEKEQKL